MFAARGSVLPFLNVFLVSTGLSVTQAGFISGFRFIISCLATPCWSFIGELTKYSKYVFLCLVVLSTLLIVPLPWIAKVVPSWHLQLLQGKNCSETFPKQIRKTFRKGSVDCSSHSEVDILFFVMLIVNLGNASFHLPLPVYIDHVTRKVINTTNERVFSDQRNYTALGFAIACLLSGVLCHFYQIDGISEYTAIVYVYLPMVVILIFLTFIFFHQTKHTENIHTSREVDITIELNETSNNNHRNNISKSNNKSKALQLLVITFCDVNVMLFLLTLILMGGANELVYGFLFLFIEELNPSSYVLMGLAIFTSSLAEFLFHPIAENVMKQVKRPLICICLSVFSYFLRFFLLSITYNAWLIIPIQLLHSVGYSLFWAAVKKQTRMISPDNIASLISAFIHIIHFSFAGIIAQIIGGYLYTQVKGHQLFQWASFLYLLWGLVVAAQIILLRRREIYKVEKNVEMDELNESSQIQTT